ncbi:PGF-CTERM protein/surface glycoprotein [Natrinema salifodinae]|uniref:PGF-CTERM protein/surface glycoprotein n=4 Tax=Halobacteriales TaxID=2235 RepID=A0A1I0LZR2_9EURY|nr:PGF-CTERM protein/surface glycoprotein [Natrinema salifodinae]
MTSETTYREKGRAVVLAALMVMSVVAMSAAFAGGVAAKQPASATNDVVYTSSDDLDGDDLWLGQEVTVGDSISQSGFEIHSGLSGSDNYVTTVKVDEGQGTFEVNPDDFETGEPYHIQTETGDTWHNVEFWVESENLNVEFTRDTVSSNDEAVPVTFESERDDQWVNVTADNLETSELERLFHKEETETNDGTVALDVSVDGSTELTADFNNADLDTGEYNITFDVTDSAASDTATVEVTDSRLDYAFADVEQTTQGEITNITVDVSESSTPVITLGGTEYGYATHAKLTNVEEEEVVVQFDTHDVHSNPWSVHEDSDAEIAESDTSVYTADGFESGDPLPSYNWDLSIGDELDSSTSDDYDLVNEHDRDRLVVQDRAAIGDVTTNTAPAADTLETLDDLEDTTVTETNTIAEGDHLIVSVEDFGAEGLVEDIANDDSVALENALTSEGIFVELTEQNSGPIGTATAWNSSTENPDAEPLDLTGITVDEYSGDLILKVDVSGDASEELQTGETYDFSFNVTQKNTYVDDEDETFGHESTISIEDREVEWDAIESLPAAEDATATGTTTVAPGTELSAEADSPTDQGGFVQVADAVVTAGDDGNHQFAAEFDLSEETPGVTFDLYVDDRYESSVSDELSDVNLTAADEPVVAIDVSGDAPSTVNVDEDATLNVTVTNNGDATETVDYHIEVNDDTVVSDELELEAGEEFTDSYEFDTSEAGDLVWNVHAGDASDSGTLTVEEESTDGTGDDSGSDDSGSDDSGSDDSGSDDSGTDDSGSDGDDGEDGTPGFGVSVAAVALLAAALLALRRDN